MKTFHVDSERLGPVMVRVVPTARVQGEGGAPLADENGQPILLGRVIVPGCANSAYGNPEPRQVRLKVAGQLPEGLVDGSVVRFDGKVTVTSWFVRGGRGRDAKSEITLTPEFIHRADGHVPAFEGLLPVRSPAEEPFTLMGFQPVEGRFEVALVVPSSVVDAVGTVRVLVDIAPPDGLIGRPVRLEGLALKLIQPDAEDVGRTSKASFTVYATEVVPAEPAVLVGATSRSRRAEPAPEAPPEPSVES